MKKFMYLFFVLVAFVLAYSLLFPFLKPSSDDGYGWTIFDRFTTLVGFAATLLATYGIVLASSKNWREWLAQIVSSSRYNGPDHEVVVAKMDSILLLIGNSRPGNNPADITVRLCKPTRIAAICTRDSLPEFQRLRGEWLARGIRTVAFREVAGPDDFIGARRAATELLGILRENRQSAEETIAADVTGTTKPIGIGSFVAAEQNRIPTIYLRRDLNRVDGKPIAGSERLVFLTTPIILEPSVA